MSKNINYPSDFYVNDNNTNSNENYIYENEQLANQNYSPNKDKDIQSYNSVTLNQPPQDQPLPNIDNMLNYEPDVRDENDLKKPKLRKTFYKLPPNVSSYRMKNKSYVDNCPNMSASNENMNGCKYLSI